MTLEKNIRFKSGEISLPTSKSLSNRALVIRELTKNRFDIHELSNSDDTRNLIQQLELNSKIIDVGAAGTNMRFLISLYSYLPGIRTITGSERMLQRPVGQLVSALNRIGAHIEYLKKDNYPPIQVAGGNLRGGKTIVDGNISSQFISSLLMIAPVMENEMYLEIKGEIVSRPYIQMTLDLMEYFGIKYAWEGNIITIAPQEYIAKTYTVEGDWSAAGFLYGFVACCSVGTSIHIKNISLNSLQGDKKTADHFLKLGVVTIPEAQGITIKKENGVNQPGLKFDLLNEPDLFPAMAFTCATLKTKATFTGLQTLNLKESKRIETIAEEIKKIGAISEITHESLTITGYTYPNKKIIFDTYHDHRIAMAASISSMSGNTISINEPDVVSKSYPDYWEDLKKIAIVNIY